MTKADHLANCLAAVGCSHPRSHAVLLLEVYDELEDDVTTGARLLDEAGSLVNGPRQDSYGEPVDCMRRWADMLRAAFDWDVDAHKAALAMSLLKHVREAYSPDFANRVDAVGYLEIADRTTNVRPFRPVEAS